MDLATRRRGSPSAARAFAVLACLAALLLPGCAAGAGPGGEGAGPTTASGSGSGSGSRVPGSGGPRATTPAGSVLASRPEIVEDLKGAVDTVKGYWAKEFAARGRQFEPVRAVYAYVPGDGTTCGGEPNVPKNASYCRPDDRIGFDVRWTAQVYDGLGDAFVYYLIGHEYAHAVQARLGTTLAHTIEYELQADCYAGAYLGDRIRSGELRLEGGDIDELRAGLRAVADPAGTPWFDPAAHGTAEQRISFFGRGFDRSLSACP